MKIILASSSPRRKELLKLIVPKFDVLVSGIDENLKEGLTIQDQVMRLSYMKAKDIYNKTSENRIIIAADTIVTKNGKIYGKPRDIINAKKMIHELLEGNKVHSIFTGLAIIINKNGEYKEYKTFDEVKVFLKDMTEEEIEKWLNTGNAMDKAGSYGIQNEFCVFVDKIEGNYTTAIGLPTHKVYDIIKQYIK